MFSIQKILRQRINLILGLFVFLVVACKPNPSGKITSDKLVPIQRFEQDLFSISPYGLKDSIPFLAGKYPDFFPLFCYKIIEIGGPSNPGFADGLLAFVSDFTIYRLHKHVAEVFPTLEKFQPQLSLAFNRFGQEFPDHKVPRIITSISGFNQSIVVSDSLLVISLDKYLGTGDEFYSLLYPPVPQYVRNTMYPAKIPSDAIRALLETEFPYNDEKDNLVAEMIFAGRIMFASKKIMPETHDSVLWGYSPAQLDFCEQNEKQMWTYLVENKLLFTTEKLILTQYINEAPFTKDFSKDSPGRAAVWIGYKIIQAYMEENKNTSLMELMAETNYLKILNLSKYNP